MKQRIPTQFLQINLARSDEIKNWAERLVKNGRVEPPTGEGIDRKLVGGGPIAALQGPAEGRSPRVGFASPPLVGEQPSPATTYRNVSRHASAAIGEVKKADTLNYRTLKPERDGLFCERIFGPTSDWVCACGQTKERGGSMGGGLRATDHERALRGELPVRTCLLCGVEATTSRFRRYRMGYIGLACPVTHIWYLNSRPNLFAILLKMPTKYIKKIVYYKAYSPSLGRPEYLSPCLSPGGDFFDNEWEYLHGWLAGKSSSQDILAGWNFVQAQGRRNWGEALSAGPAGRNRDQALTHERQGRSLRAGGPIAARHPTSPAAQRLRSRYAPTKWLAVSPFHSFTMPEFPNWLENTGAQALVNQLETKNWTAEISKLERNLLQHESDSRPQEPMSLQLACRDPAFDDKKRKTRLRQLKLLKTFEKSGFPTTQMIFSNLPVLPPELRPIIQLGGGQLASSDVNDLYRRVISRNNRLKYYLYETHFVEFLVRSEQQLVQLAVDALLENGKTTQVRHTSGQKRLYRSLTDRIGGKQGRFRMNLLGKRVDYSGRSVIVVGPSLDISNCGLPYEMAGELFQPFLLRHLLELNLCKTIRAAKNILRLNKAFARQCMHSILGSHPILLNRAPTLHRLGIQAFHPILVFGRAIHLHPLVCPAFNADFDGDQMAVHIPLLPAARMEARLLMLASGNWLSASTGQPNLLPSQDMVLGFYYVTLEKPGFQKGKGQVYQNLTDAVQAYESGEIDLHSQIWVYLSSGKAVSQPWVVVGGAADGKGPRHTTSIDQVLTTDCLDEVDSKLRWTTKKAQIQLSADVLSRKNTLRSHSEAARKSKQRLQIAGNLNRPSVGTAIVAPHKGHQPPSSGPARMAVGAGVTGAKPMSAPPQALPRHPHNPQVDQPLQIRLHTSGLTTKIYPSYQWKEDIKKNIRMSSIRTTPGRILLNQIIQKYL